MSIVMNDNTATPGPPDSPGHPAGHAADTAVGQALAAAAADPARVGDLLDVLGRGRLWVPLPDDGRPVTDGSAVDLPTVTYLGADFVPAYTSAQLLQEAGEPEVNGEKLLVPHVVVRTVDLARLLPPGLGIALNPGLPASVPVYPEGVAYLARAEQHEDAGRVTVGPLPGHPDALLSAVRAGLSAVPAAREASAAWLSVEGSGEGLIFSVALDEPADSGAQADVIGVLERSAAQEPQDAQYPIDVTFPGEGEPDPIDEWISAFAAPFYRRY